jgi:2-dehydropantoate 2-reductase
MFSLIAIIGSGAIGLYYGGRLAQSGHDVRFLIRNDYDEVMKHGIDVKSIHGDFHLPHVKALKNTKEIGAVDLVIIAWKTTSNHLLKEILPPLLHKKTQVLTLQNGLGNCESISEIIGENRVIGGLCFVCINRISAGHIHHSANGKVSLAEFSKGIPNRADAIAQMFEESSISAIVETNIEEVIWRKLIWNIPFNGLVITEGGKTTDQLLSDHSIVKKIKSLMHEVIQIAKARGFVIDEKIIALNIKNTRAMGAYKPSSLIDWQEGREIEIDAIWTNALQHARDLEVNVPHLEKLLLDLHASTKGDSK